MSNVVTLEEHSTVLAEWFERDIRDRTVVCLDAHLDLQQIADDRVAALRRCTSPDEVRRLEKNHHLSPADDCAYGIEDFLYAAHSMEMVRQLIWVAPPHVDTGYSHALAEQLGQMAGVRLGDIAGFHRNESGMVCGSLLGLEIIICRWEQLPELVLPADTLIDIDTDFFTAVPGDALWAEPRSIFEVLHRLPHQRDLVTISRSVSSGFTPLRHRYVADLMAALFDGNNPDVEHFQRVYDWDMRLQSNEDGGVITECLEEIERHGQCAATYHLLELAHADSDIAQQYGDSAASLSPAYMPDPLRDACGYINRRMPVGREEVERLEQLVRSGALEPARSAFAHAAIGLILCAGGQLPRAQVHYQLSEVSMGPHPELALELAKLFLQSPYSDRAVPYLDLALEHAGTRTAAHFFHAHLSSLRGDRVAAVESLTQTLAAAPLWAEARESLAELYQLSGNPAMAESERSLLAEQRETWARLESLLGSP